MSKIKVDIDAITGNLKNIGYIINDIVVGDNNGTNWKIAFSNSGAIATIYDSNRVKNTVVNGKCNQAEKEQLKSIIDGLKSGEYTADPLNETIVKLILSRKEDYYYDFKETQYGENKRYDLLHDIICLLNNTANREAYLIIGVTNDYEPIGVEQSIESNNLIDWFKHLAFAGNVVPDIEVKHLFYTYKKIDVIVCKPSFNVPYYLEKREGKVEPFHIYTRVGDTNTPVNENASHEDVCKLWKYHFSNN